ncbi:MAG TPA: FecR family protein [Spirochaetota bacterium]|nr:FecR family protein [Spirochaetota bacterium]HPI87951.1 FecR family protein [Spirochaetota bacterium]HPR46662.1 FecR family protein [Spirochaetota bacterium]
MKQVLTASFIILLIVISSCKKEHTQFFKIENFIGDVVIQSHDTRRQPAAGDYLAQNDVIITGENSCADVLYSESSIIRVNENSTMEVSLLDTANRQSEVDLKNGRMFAVLSKIKKDYTFKAKAKTIVVSVRGTSFRVRADAASSGVDVVSGEVRVNPVVDGKEITEVTGNLKAEQTITLDMDSARRVAQKEAPIQVREISPVELKEINAELQKIESEKFNQLRKEEQREQENILQSAFDDTYTSFLGLHHGDTINRAYSIFGEPSQKQMPEGANKYAMVSYAYNNKLVMNMYYHIDTKKISTFVLGNFENPLGGHDLVLQYLKSRGVQDSQKTFLGKSMREIKRKLGSPTEEKESMCRYTGKNTQAVFTFTPQDRVCNILSLVWY